jgi:nitrate reductase delta subunit
VIGRRHRDADTLVLKLCSVLLGYPDAELHAAGEELRGAIDGLPGAAATDALVEFFAWWSAQATLALEQHYVQTFDLDKRCGLYLTFYGEGDRRQRGAALLRLKRLYRAAGLPLEAAELPDFLPAMLEFAAAAPGRQGTIVLREHRAALELLRQSLHDHGTPYALLLDAVCLTVGEPSAADRARVVMLAAAGPPEELVGLEPFSREHPGLDPLGQAPTQEAMP